MSDDLSTLSLSELYDELIPPAAPADISMFPQTVGWIWLGLAILATLGFLLNLWLKYRRENAYRRAAIGALKRAGDDPVALANVLRKTALAAFPRQDVAGLIGDSWLAFLDSTAGKPLFTDTAAGTALIHAPYQSTHMPSDLPARAKEWVTSHKVQKRGGA
ncbi:DUF4381 domain-containing protein [Falsihalocynthiibacter arcticus]|uniref:DUF4381 domain-containing protein n=1 Tax=Falsihalocynthiibacter arcticus TaxID=1579316 RepID=A0A126UYK3_9RHOB|nr:DUF4381 domain-containing protein [Falsihalocynthiibacter arcticus]AML51124.1 hypothetical protein RC74_07470 [Falsihalocynthiibacter arcticus]